jgi:hypothetical protein|tara:strand:- start:173 stop:463 length:291 start_codon:yes stop_codon:yes gene_type:complete
MQSKIDVPGVVLGNVCGKHVTPSESVGTTVYLHLPNVLQLVQSVVTLLPQQLPRQLLLWQLEFSIQLMPTSATSEYTKQSEEEVDPARDVLPLEQE